MGTPSLSTQQIDDLYTTTYAYRKPKVVNQVYTSTPFWYMMTKNGKMDAVRGGKWIEQPLAYGKNTTVKFFGKGDTFAVKDENITTAAIYDWKYLGGSLVRYMVDEQRNSGDNVIKKWINMKIDNLTSSLIDYAETSLFSDGTADGGREFGGLGSLIPISPLTGTVGNINRATYDWWRNYYYNMGADSTALYLRKKMSTAFNTCGKYGEQSDKNDIGVLGKYPNLIITDQASYELYEDELFELKIIQSATAGVGDLGFGTLLFKGVPLTWSSACPAGYMYFINTNFLNWVYDPDYNFVMDEWKTIPNQAMDRVTQVITAGNLTMSNARKQGVLYGIGTTA